MKKIRERVLRGDASVTCFHDMSGFLPRSAETSLGAAGMSACATSVGRSFSRNRGARREQEWGELSEVAAPYQPGVRARGFDGREMDVLGLEPLAELAIRFAQA